MESVIAPLGMGGFAKIWKEQIYNKSYENLIIIPTNSTTENIDILDSAEYKACVSKNLKKILCYGYTSSPYLWGKSDYDNRIKNRFHFEIIAPKADCQYYEMNKYNKDKEF